MHRRPVDSRSFAGLPATGAPRAFSESGVLSGCRVAVADAWAMNWVFREIKQAAPESDAVDSGNGAEVVLSFPYQREVWSSKRPRTDGRICGLSMGYVRLRRGEDIGDVTARWAPDILQLSSKRVQRHRCCASLRMTMMASSGLTRVGA